MNDERELGAADRGDKPPANAGDEIADEFDPALTERL